LIRRERADLVLIVSSRLPAALIAARRERVPTLIYAAEIHHGPGVGSRPRRRLGLGLLRLTARGADAVIVPSRTAAAQFPAALRAKVRVVYPPVTADSARGDAERFRRRHGIGAHEPCILVVGNLTPPRGQDLLLRCLPSIRSRVAGARLVLVGPTFDRPRDVAFEAELGALAKTLGISSALTLAGYEPEIADAYAAASVVVNPGLSTHPESFGLAACEALVAGRPVVTARVGAVSEVLDGVPGVEMVPPGDPEQLADAVVRMLVDSERAGGAARDGGQEVLRRFPPERSMAAFREVVEGIAPAARHRSTPGRASSPPS
jgi:phosphatidylinositol alpha-1,6-mannosyltransferase